MDHQAGMYEIFCDISRDIFAVSATGMYKLLTDAGAWIRVNASIGIPESLMPMAEHKETLYIASTDEIFASTDKGETWNAFCGYPKGDAIGLIITDASEAGSGTADITMYLAFRDEGISAPQMPERDGRCLTMD